MQVKNSLSIVLERKFNKESSEKQERLAENGLQCIIEVESCLKEYRVNYFADFGDLARYNKGSSIY